MEQRPSERRIGARKAVIGLHCRWDLDGAGQKKRFLRRPAEQTAEITELSVSGATIVALSSDLLVPGTAVAIEIEGAKGGVAIRNLRPSSHAGMTCFRPILKLKTLCPGSCVWVGAGEGVVCVACSRRGARCA